MKFAVWFSRIFTGSEQWFRCNSCMRIPLQILCILQYSPVRRAPILCRLYIGSAVDAVVISMCCGFGASGLRLELGHANWLLDSHGPCLTCLLLQMPTGLSAQFLRESQRDHTHCTHVRLFPPRLHVPIQHILRPSSTCIGTTLRFKVCAA